jgi:stearoyl-CoA desaturase (delta-9 desaturase)
MIEFAPSKAAAGHAHGSDHELEKPDWVGSIAFISVHLACLGVIWTGWSWTAVGVCAFMYFIRMFGITAGYHRYFSHKSYKTSRLFQFLMGVLGCSSAQQGPLWWAAHHRHHHRHSDTEEDIHSPGLRGLWWAHVGWILCKKYATTNVKAVQDLAKFPELRFLDRFHILAPIALGVAMYWLGLVLSIWAPGLGTSGPQMLVWGLFISTVFLYHGTFTINSLSHMIGKPRFVTGDFSKNSLLLALVTLGEGWHNNHHRYPAAEQQGFYWWEIDVSHYMLKMLSKVGLVWDLKPVPDHIYEEAKGGSRKHAEEAAA